MNIWIDPSLLLQNPAHNDELLGSACRRDDCPGGETGPDIRPDEDEPVPGTFFCTSQHAYDMLLHTFVCSGTLYIQRHDDERWIVCTTTGAGKLAVLDMEAYHLLECFRHPQTLRDAITTTSTAQAILSIAVFIHLGFLQDLDQPDPTDERGAETPHTLSAWMHVTNACNLRCDYCYVSKTSEHMGADIAKRSVDSIIRSANAYRYRSIHLTFAGGEATLRTPEVIATYDYAREQSEHYKLGLSASIISNGAALPLKFIEQLKQRGIRISISLDGIGAAHDQQRHFINGQGSFSFVDRTIARLIAAGHIPYINVTVTRRNLNALPDLLEYVLQRNLPFGLSYYRENECSTDLPDLQFTDAQMISGMRTAFAYIEENLPRRSLMSALIDKASTSGPRQYACGMGRNYMVIDQRGGVAKCQVDIRNTVTTVNADNPLRVIRADRRGVQAVPVDEKEGCRSCEWRYWCSGGCPMLTHQLTGRSDIKSPNCAIYKALFPEALRLEALRLLTYQKPITF